MKNAHKIINQLAQADIELFVKNGQLKARAAKGQLSSEYIDIIKNNKSELLNHLIELDSKIQPQQRPEIKPLVGREEYVITSYSQQRLWFIDQMDGNNGHYNMPSAMRMSGYFDLNIANKALTKIIQRHESLRTNFQLINDVPHQFVQEDFQFSITVHDIQHLSESEQQVRCEYLIEKDANTGFDFCNDLMLRSSFIKTSVQEGLLLFNMHHIASDGWSINVLAKEFAELYQAYMTQRPPQLPILDIQYVDYAHWQRQWLQGEVLETQLRYWDKQLEDLPTVHGLALDRERPRHQTFNGASHSFVINADILDKLERIALNNNVSMFMIVHAVFAIMLSRYSNNSDIVIGTPVANRLQKELQNLIGFFANTLVLRADCRGDLSFLSFLKHIKKINLDAQSNQDVPFENLVDRLNPERSTSHNPLFQVMLSMNNNDATYVELPKVTMEPVGGQKITAKFDLELNALVINEQEQQNGLYCSFIYNTDLFNQDTIECFAASLEKLFAGVAKSPNQMIVQLPLLDELVINDLLNNNNAVDWHSVDMGIHQLFEKQVQQTPNHIAVTCQDEQLNYHQLNTKANELAHYLIKQHTVSVGDVIGVCMHRGINMVVAMLAIAKVGATYLPMDPSYPQERINNISEHSNLLLVITQRETALFFSESKCIVIDDQVVRDDISKYDQVNPIIEGFSSEQLAYIIYTSGSTGQPKGVMIQHKAFINFILAMQKQLKNVLHTQTKWLAVTTISFDISGLEIFGPLSFGGQVLLASSEQVIEPNLLAKLLIEKDITCMQATPAMWQMMVDNGWQGKPDLTILSGGEALSLSLAENLLDRCQQLWNCYGPTEATVWSLVQRIDSSSLTDKCVSIGGSLPNYYHLVLDRFGALCPRGTAGELYIGGYSLAKGYYNAPELTAQSFIDNPLNGDIGDILYRTGDLVRYIDNDSFEFIGRSDHQIKVRGFRIELGEIEHKLRQHENVINAVVTANNSTDGNNYLVAYFTSNKYGDSTLIADLKNTLQIHLPEYMVPSLYMCLKDMPLTPNGKINRKALPDPTIPGSEYFAPQGEIEISLSQIWAKLLHIDVEKVSRDANFFELGGHSLLSVRLLSEVRNNFDCELSVRDIFDRPQLSQLAKKITHIENTVNRSKIDKINRDSNKFRSSYAQQRLWFIDQMEGGSAHYNMPSAMRVKGHFNLHAAEKSFKSIIERHEILRTVFVEGDDGPLQVINDKVDFTIDLIDLSIFDKKSQEVKIKSAIANHAQTPFNLQKDVMLRVSYILLKDDEGVLLFNMHHIASDGWSVGVLVNEFTQLYKAYNEGKDKPFRPLGIQYVDYAHWQRQWLESNLFESQLQYWHEKLADLPQVHGLPLSNKRPAVQSFNGESIQCDFGKKELFALKGIALDHNITLFMLLHGVFSLLLSRYSDSDDIVVGTIVANRLQKELEPLIGFFVNTLILRIDCSNNPTLMEFLLQVKNTNLDAQANQDVPFEHLVDLLNPVRSTSYSAVVQILFSMDTNEAQSLTLPGVELSPENYSNQSTKFELSLNALEYDEGLIFQFKYNKDIFNASFVERLGKSFLLLLKNIINDVNGRIADFEILDDQQRNHLLYGLNQTQVRHVNQQCIHQVFEKTVIDKPDEVALIFEDQSLTYLELNQKANQLSHYLLARGITDNTILGLYSQRSVNMIVAMIAILKCGAAYLPLDTNQPIERLNLILSDSRIKCIVSDLPVSKLTLDTIDVVDMNDRNQIKKHLFDNPEVENSLSQLAYVIYTSGSTGLPKGVMVEHKNVMAYYVSLQQQWKLLNGDKLSPWLWNASYAFDASVKGLLSLCAGRGLVLPNDTQAKDPSAIVSLIQKHQVGIYNASPYLMDIVLSHLIEQKLHHLPDLILGGEHIPRDIFVKVAQYCQHNNRKAINAYGPTETTINSTYGLINKTLNIGRPIANTQVYILDNNRNLVPYGSIGELYIGGDGISRGYLNRPDLTAERFIDHEFPEGLRTKLYRSGDLVRYLASGELSYEGRIDDQVKIRGFRIELGEVEHHLANIDGIDLTRVMIRNDQAGQQQLVAYIILDKNKNDFGHDEISAIKQQLRQKLPDYMVPNFFMRLDELPVTFNGKIDYQALPQPERIVGHYIAPVTEIEEKLVVICCNLLNLDKESISMDANFFEMGGHSLLSVRLISEIRDTFSCELSIKTVFEKPQLLELAKEIKLSAVSLRPKITKIDRDTHQLMPSYAQQRLWFIDQMEGESSHYNMPSAMRIKGEFNLDAAQQAFEQIIERHETLRTVFVDGKDGPIQVINENVDFKIRYIDLIDENKDAQNKIIRQSIRQDAESPFNISQDLMLRVCYLNLNNDEGVLLFNMHHIASDGWSMGILVKEFTQLYRSIIDGVSHPLPPLDIQYADYAHWQRHWLAGEVFESQLSYWDKQLADLPQAHDLPLDHDRPSHQTYNGGFYSFNIGREVLAQLQNVTKEHHVTLFMIVHAVFAIVLSRYSNNTDIVIGTPVANRLQKELGGLIGYFVNTLVLRCQCNGDLTFIEFLELIKSINIDAQAHQDVPFEYLVDRLKPERSVSHNPLFQVMLSMNTTETSIMELPNLSISPEQSEGAVAKFDLLLNATSIKDKDSESGLHCSFIYNTDLFEETTIERLSDGFIRLFSTIAQDASQMIAQLPLLAAKEKRYLIETLNDTESAYPHELCIHQWFEQQVKETPDNIAVTYKDKSITYESLNNKANQLAHYLIEQGVKPDTLVGLCLDRSINMVIALLGILKAGGAYVPLDPRYPEARLTYQISDADISIIVTQESQQALMPSLDSVRSVCLDNTEMFECLQGYSKRNVSPKKQGLHCNNLAYVIYTSGTTGNPKGVMIEHNSVINLCCNLESKIPEMSTDQWGWAASLSFDASVQGICALLLGQALNVIPHEAKTDVNLFERLLKEHPLNIIDCTPTLVELWLNLGLGSILPNLLIGGEAISNALWSKLLVWQQENNKKAYNVYGPTECCVDSSFTQITDEKPHIGRALNNVEFYVLGTHCEVIPYGIVGELYIAGAGLARGYLNRDQLTQQKFIEHRFVNGQSKRLYKTGDLVQYIDDGNLNFIGRVDDQVKIRGFRIELGEIEQQLKNHPQVESSLVTVSDEQTVVAYVIVEACQDKSSFIKDMLLFLKGHLPDYMIPSSFVILDAFPLTVNGKIDRKALPKPEFLQSEYVAPEGEIEKGLGQIWSQLLNVDEEIIGRNANFFEMGGHSLLSVRLISEIRDTFSCELSIKTVFEKPQLLELAKEIKLSAVSLRPKITKMDRDTHQLMPSYAQQRLWFIDQMEGESSHYNMPSAMRIKGEFNLDAAQQAFQQIIERHETLRTVFVDGKDGPIQVINENVDFKIRYIDLIDKNKDAQNKIIRQSIRQDAESPFNISQDLMLRVCYLNLNNDEGVLLFNMHHIASDGWSMGILVKEFTQLYRSIIDGVSHPLQPLDIQYADYAYWQRHWLAGEVFESQLSYWDKQLADLPQVHDLPLDHDRPNHQTYNGGFYSFNIGREVLAQLQNVTKEHHVTLFMIVHAVFAIILSRYSNNTDIVIGTPVANRLQKELGGLIGYFVNTLVLRCQCNGDLTFIEFLEQIKSINIDAQAHQDVPFEYLVDRLKPERSVSHNPLFQVMLSMNTTETSVIDFPDVSFSPEQSEGVVAKFDLLLNATSIIDNDSESGLHCSFIYNTDLFEEKTIERLSDGFIRLFSTIAQDASQMIAQLPLLAAKEKRYLIETLNDTESTYPDELCIHQWFEQQVKETPDNIAVTYKDKSITYESLNSKANQLAHYLIEQGIVPDDIVGLCMHRSMQLMIAIIAVLKAGGAYMPLDPDYPHDRLQHMITKSGSKIIITQKHLIELTKDMGKQVIIDDNKFTQELFNNPSENPVIEHINSRHLAYVIYTSGSTGQPKGVMIEHQALVNRIDWMQNEYGLTYQDVVLQKTPYSFDVSVWEFTWFFTVGAQLVIAEPEGHKDSEYLIDLIQRHRITTLHFVPSMFRIMLTNKSWSECDSLQQIFCSGEALSVDLTTKHYGLNKAQLHNLYGPTEAAIDVSYWPVPTECHNNKVPIGKPIQNIQLLILNDQLELQPEGSPGELFIGGVGLARGYLNQPDLTEQRFIKNPFEHINSDRLYRTGDIVRYLDNGDIEFIGRIDNQVKLRGLRIELSEIDYQLSELPEVNASITIIKQEKVGHEYLVTYFTSTSELDERALIDEIKSRIKRHLPNYMVPAVYIRLDDMPLTLSGKINHKALPDIEFSESEYVSPQGKVEILLSQMWSRFLNIEQDKISRFANFFELGGHSLLLLPLINQLKERGINCSIKTFYEHQTLAEICQTFKSSYTSHEESLVKLNDVIEGHPLFIVHPLSGRVDCYANLAKHLPVPVFGIQAPFFSEHHIPFEDINTLATFYADAIIQQQEKGPYRLAGWSAGGLIAQHIAQVLIDRGFEVEYFVGIDSFMIQPFEQFKCRYQALKQVIGTIELASNLSEDIVNPDLVKHSYDEQLNILYDEIDFSGSGMSKLQIIQGFKFRVDFFMATIELKQQSITGRSRLFIAEKNTKQPLLFKGWQKAINCKNNIYVYIDGDHNSLLDGNNLQAIIKTLIRDIEELKD